MTLIPVVLFVCWALSVYFFAPVPVVLCLFAAAVASTVEVMFFSGRDRASSSVY
jgi:hypothetical protein